MLGCRIRQKIQITYKCGNREELTVIKLRISDKREVLTSRVKIKTSARTGLM